MCGMPLREIIAAATVNAARVFPSFDNRGTLNVGAPADVAILKLRKARLSSSTTTKARAPAVSLFPAGTVLAGKIAPRV